MVLNNPLGRVTHITLILIVFGTGFNQFVSTQVAFTGSKLKGVLIVNFEHFTLCSSVSIYSEHVIAGWVDSEPEPEMGSNFGKLQMN